MKNLTLEQITIVCSGEYVGDVSLQQMEVSSITTDSRKVEKNALFVPIVGARVDGHDFINQVMEKGAICTLSEVELENPSYPYIKVKSSLEAIKAIATYYLEQLNVKVVGITGSVGKTSTKEMVASVLASKYGVLKTLGNFNNELGLPLTIFRLTGKEEVAVLEMGISDFHEMDRLAQIAKPDVAVITNIGICHLENLGDRDGVLKAKTEIFNYLKSDGHIILNGDDDKLKTVTTVNGIKPDFFGLQADNRYYATDVEDHGLRGMECTIHTPTQTFTAHIQIPGVHMVYNALAATAVGEELGLTAEEIKSGIEACVPVGGRNRILETKEHIVIDDCYNANPISMKAGIDVLKRAEGRKVAILGDMGELGEKEQQLHYEVGAYAAKQGIDVVIGVGTLCKQLTKGAKEQQLDTTTIYHFESKQTLFENINKILEKGDTILVKASHFMGFEEIVKYLS